MKRRSTRAAAAPKLQKRSIAQTLTPEEWKTLNAGIAEHLAMTWSTENDALLKRVLGERLYRAAEELLGAMSNGDEWLQGDLSSAADRAAARVRGMYPKLGDGALDRMILRAQYGWR